MKNSTKQKKWLIRLSVRLFIGITFLASGCATPRIKPIDKIDFSSQLQFLIDGTTAREEVLLRLGEPSGRFEGDRILTYILSIDGNRKLRVLPRQLGISRIDPRVYELNPMACSLVLVFQNENTLKTSELICSSDKL